MKTVDCIWFVNIEGGICGFDISQPGRQVLCMVAGCRECTPKPSTADLKNAEAVNVLED